jgi:hypothetical protein
MPDEALDQHTNRGKEMGRDAQHWLDEGCRLDNDARRPARLR